MSAYGNARMVIVGGGPVGLALALASSALSGVDVEVIERGTGANEKLPEPFDHRVYALSNASIEMLRTLGVALPPARMAPVRAMQIHGDANVDASKLDFNSGQSLATIVEHAALLRAMETRLSEHGRVRIRRGVSPLEMQSTEGNLRRIILSDGEIIDADLLIAADGSRSQIREWAGITTTVKNYESVGVVANFATERHHGDIARQWFKQDSVLACLPLPGNHISIVWSMQTDSADALPVDDAAALSHTVEAAGHAALGSLTLVSPVGRFPLSRIMARNWVLPGLALIGDAAHTVHPLAGQGVNLGFADVRNMVSILQDRSTLSDIGDLAVLRRYERSAREAAWAVGTMTDRLRSLYLSEDAPARWLRNDGIGWLNRIPSAKTLLINYASR